MILMNLYVENESLEKTTGSINPNNKRTKKGVMATHPEKNLIVGTTMVDEKVIETF